MAELTRSRPRGAVQVLDQMGHVPNETLVTVLASVNEKFSRLIDEICSSTA